MQTFPKPKTPGKGKKGENCNVTSCQRPYSALYFNRVMNAYYCSECAEEIERSANTSGLSLFDNLKEHMKQERNNILNGGKQSND